MKSKNHVGSVRHWWMQRVTALIMVPLLFWFIYIFFMSAFLKDGQSYVDSFLSDPLKAIFFFCFIACALYHSVLGMRVICEDYIPNRYLRILAIWSIQLFSVFTLIFCIFSLLFVYQSLG